MNKFVVKLLLNGIIVIPLLMWFTEATFMGALVFSAILSAIAYIVGDKLILKGTNNTIATISDALLAGVFLWIAADFLEWTLTFGELLMIAIILAIAEVFFHRYLGNRDPETAS